MTYTNPSNVRELVGQKVGDWSLTEYIDEGASAAVFKAIRGTEVAAVKVYNQRIVQRFGQEVQETRINRQLSLKGHNHPYLIPILDGGTCPETNLLYLVMELTPFPTLATVINRLPRNRIAPLLAQIASAANFLLEEKSIVHRDIKPANIVVTKDFRKAILLDLGVIRGIDETNITDDSRNRPFVGTIRYSSPEFIERREQQGLEGWRALTFYQLGAVLHDMICRCRLFGDVPDNSLPALIEAVRHTEPSLDFSGEVNSDLVELARECLRKNWQERLASVEWRRFELRRLVRRPTVVLLYAGGTIGSTTADDTHDERCMRKVPSRHNDLLERMKQRLVRDYRQLFSPSDDLPFDLEWEILPPDQQLLSENAGPETWNNLVESVDRVTYKYFKGIELISANHDEADERLNKIFQMELEQYGTEFPGSELSREKFCASIVERYVIGIIILHGTDTLAYSAPALAFGMHHLPCPVIMTGSNQPPDEKNILEHDLVTSDSDAWKNLVKSLYFMQCVGHHCTEVFVCFGETIHHAVNIRKVSIERIPLKREAFVRPLEEPYTFRNEIPQRQYAFKIIDGVFCNNFYPIWGRLTYHSLASRPRDRHLRHTSLASTRPLERNYFSSCVQLIKVNPSMPDLNISWQPESANTEGGLRLLLVEGYKSGTFPTDPRHSFHNVLEKLIEQEIPLALVARYGLIPAIGHYEMQPVGGRRLPVLRLFGVIAETALPLLSIVLGKIAPEEWTPDGKDDRLDYRMSLIEKKLRAYQEESGDTLNYILGDIVDEHKYREHLAGLRHQEQAEHDKLVSQLLLAQNFSRVDEKEPARPREGRRPSRSEKAHVVLRREHFFWNILEFLKPFERSGAGVDAFALMSDMGFSWGMRECERHLRHHPRVDDILFPFMGAEKASELILRVRSCARAIARRLRLQGLADANCDLEVEPIGNSVYSLELTVKVSKRDLLMRSDELYAVQACSEDNAKFFTKLRKGQSLEEEENEYEADLQRCYRKLLEACWRQRTSGIDWFVLGAFKAVACNSARYLLLDPWIERCNNDELPYVEALRQSVRAEIKLGNRDWLNFSLVYISRAIYPLGEAVL